MEIICNNKTLKILLKCSSSDYIWFIDSENLWFNLILKEKMTILDILIMFISLTLK